MPDGWNPDDELNRIYTLIELMYECRKRVPVIIARLDEMLANDDLRPGEMLAVCDMVLNRAYGKPRQHVYLSEQPTQNPVKVYLPDNNRQVTLENSEEASEVNGSNGEVNVSSSEITVIRHPQY
jgi:hypothetical protein